MGVNPYIFADRMMVSKYRIAWLGILPLFAGPIAFIGDCRSSSLAESLGKGTADHCIFLFSLPLADYWSYFTVLS